jgi:putative flippase GtrA
MIAFIHRVLRSDALSGRFTRYFIVGGSAAIVDLGGFFLFLKSDFSTVAAAASSFAIAAIYNFALSSTLVFRFSLTWRRLVMFMAFAVVGLVINTSVTSLAALSLPGLLAKTVGILVAFGVNFWMNNSVVFRVSTSSSGP